MSSVTPLAIYGAGGFAREVFQLARAIAQPRFDVVCFIDDHVHGESELYGLPVVTLDTVTDRFSGDCQVTIAVASPLVRPALASKVDAVGLACATLIHPNVDRSDRVHVQEGSILCSRSVLTTDIHIGRHVQINLSCTVGHDAQIEDFVTLSPGVNVSGCVHIEAGAFVGTGASILQGQADAPLVIGAGSVVAAGACITTSTEPGCLYAGVPAKLKKRY